jgi:putative nucleotidyltransferase with HDIG domain
MVTLELDTSMVPLDLALRLETWVHGQGMELPLLPEAAQEAMRAATSDDTDARKLSEIIRRDQTLASHVLRVANSPLYAGRTRIISLQQAISRLGMSTIRQIALAVSCETRVFRVKGHERIVREMFRHSLATAFVAQEIARLGRRNVEEAFLAGLLHDMGRPLVLEKTIDLAEELKVELSNDALGQATDAFHARAGATIAGSWGFSPGLVETIEYHHTPLLALTAGALAAIVALADDVAHYLLGSRPVDLAILMGHPSLGVINLYPEDLEKFLGRGPEVLSWMEAFG